MDKIKGVIFLLESLIKSGKKQWLSTNVVIDQDEAISLINKLMDAINDHEKNENTPVSINATDIDIHMQNNEYMDTKKEVLKLKQDANEYADAILSRLQLLVTKLQKNVIKIEKNISEGRRLIEEKQMSTLKGEEHANQ